MNKRDAMLNNYTTADDLNTPINRGSISYTTEQIAEAIEETR